MSVITISREIGSEGEYIARKVADGLGYHLADKDAIEAVLLKYGLVEFDRVYNTTPGFWARADASREAAIRFLNSTINALARHGDIVILGRGSFAVLQGYVDVLNVRVQAAADIRARRVMEAQSLASFEEAAAFVRREDKIRMRFVTTNYGVRWDAADLFDMVIDTGKVDPDRAAGWLLEVARDLPAVVKVRGPSTRMIELDEVLAGVICDVLDCEREHDSQVREPAG